MGHRSPNPSARRLAAVMIVMAMIVLAAPVAPQEQAARQSVAYVQCGWLLAIPGEAPRRNVTILVQGDRIVDIRPGIQIPGDDEAGAIIVDLSGCFVLPGLIDCHTHITFELGPGARLQGLQQSDADTAIKAAVFAKRTLDAGFTTIRNVGSSGDAAFAVRDAIRDGLIPGPRIIAAGHAITPTGGHGDHTHGFREDLFEVPTPAEGVADGPDACRQAVRTQVKRGADVIKLTATGGVLSETAAGTDQQFFDDELEAIVETAHWLGRKVAAHAHGADGIKAALRAGVDSIEHGTFLDDEAIRLFRQHGTYLVPTMLAGVTVTNMAEVPDLLPPVVAEKARQVGPRIHEACARAHQAGVKIAFGTDSGVSPHGHNAQEFALMVAAGFEPMQAIKSATINAADLCSVLDQVGTIEPGKQADFIALAADPLADITELTRVMFVMRAGVVHKTAERD